MTNHAHRGAKEPDYDSITFDDCVSEIIFPTKVWTAFPNEINNDEIIEDCYVYREKFDSDGVQRSNVGGWQSGVRNLTDAIFRHDLEYIYDIGCRAVKFTNECSKDMGSSCVYELESAHLWVNINSDNDYNVIHSHPKTDIIVVYYPIHEEDMGDLYLVRHDPSLFLDTFNGTSDMCHYEVRLETGLMVAFPAHFLHYVMPNKTGRDRISISFNMCAV